MITDANKQKATVGILEKLRAGGPPPPREGEMEEPMVTEGEVALKKRKKRSIAPELEPASIPVQITGRS